MKALASILKILGYVWFSLFAIVFVASIIGFFIAEPTLYHGWKRVAATLSPFNTINWIVTFLCLLPGIGLRMGSEYFEGKSN